MNKTNKLVLSAMFLALAYIMPFLTGQIPEFGSMLCPLHIPVLICGFLCGWKWGLLVGFTAPLIRSLTLGMPPLFPTAICMTFELAVYGMVAGLMYKILPKKNVFIYCSLLIAMIAGRIVWGIAMLISMGLDGGKFTFTAFIAGAFTNALPGIAIQIVVIPIIVILCDKSKILKAKK
ncbi:MAG: ECF transporter S component [Oscillospiraceae bacterium]|nr:ECF transporter S component [Oscillospiraceae bacterium]